MEFIKSKWNNYIKRVVFSIVGIALLGTVVYFLCKGTIQVSAKQDTLPGIEKIQNRYLETGEVFQILEIQPSLEAAEIGYFIGGQEPFASLLTADGRRAKWQDVLMTMETKEARAAYMNGLLQEATMVAESMGDGLFSVPSPYYEEVEATSPSDAIARGYSYIEFPGERFRGYFTGAEYNGNWRVSFKALEDTNIALDDINLGKDIPYYRAIYEEGSPLNLESLQVLASSAPNTYLYKQVNGALVFAGTATEIYNTVLSTAAQSTMEPATTDLTTTDLPTMEQATTEPAITDAPTAEPETTEAAIAEPTTTETPTTEPTATETPDANVTATVAPVTLTEAYYNPTFVLINGVEANFVTSGDMVYTVSPRNAQKVEAGGNANLVPTIEGEQAGANYTTPSTYVYYRGGVHNKELFKNKVLGLDASEYAAFRTEVTTVTPDVLNQMLPETLAEYDMVYVGRGTLKTSVLEPESEKLFYTTDITQGVLETLGNHIVTNKVPCIVDSTLVLSDNGVGVWYSFAGNTVTNFEKLVAMLISPVKEKVFSEGSWSKEYLQATEASELERLLPISEIANADAIIITEDAKEDTAIEVDVTTDAETNNVHDSSYVLKNIWVYSSKEAAFVRSNFGQKDYTQTGMLNGGYEAVLKELQSENKIRAQYGNALLNEEIHEFSVWRYIVNYQNQREEVIKSKLRVLKIEPATDSDVIKVGDRDTTMKQYLSDVSGVSAENITVDCMPITQFIGIIDDLNTTYDMIYIGSLTENLHTDSEGNTIYNDTNMNGLLYSHVGDAVLETYHVNGLLDTDFRIVNRKNVLRMNALHRYSGNDINAEKLNALMDFVDAAYPIVLAKDLLEENAEGECIRVDDSSYLYEFLELVKDYKNVLTIDEIQYAESDFSFYLNRPKMEIVGLQVLNAGDFPTNPEVKVLDKVGGVYTLSFRFSIQNDGAVSPNDLYRLKLYFDANADGKFSRINEEVYGVTIRNASGQAISADKLKAEELYYVDCIVSDNYRGCMTWELGIEQIKNSFIRTDKKGYVKINSVEEQPVRISIIQVYFHDNYQSNLILENDIGPVEYDYSTRRWKYKSPNGVGHFGTYSRAMQNEYVLDVTSISRSEFEQFVSSGSIWHNGKQITSLDDYDMLIVGFSDAFDIYYSGVDWSVAAAQKIVEFAETGKSVLLSHDTTSLINVNPAYLDLSTKQYTTENGMHPVDDSIWAYAFNQYVRNTLGMDMYGVTVSDTLKKGAALKDYRLDEDSSNDYQTEQWFSSNAFKINPETKRYEYYNFRDLAYTPRSNRSETVAQVQGYAYTLLNKRMADRGLLTYREGLSQDSTHYSQTISKINEGQITNYPFKIEDTFQVGNTHSQYYTLNMNSDMNEDMQTDLVVWFTLDGEQYGSVKDVRNNYYIYSIGNVMYTGMGHSQLYQNAQLTSMEARLFMNTLIASYKAGIQAPNVNLDAGSADAYIYNFMEPELTESFSEPVEIEFAFRDLNVHSGTKEIEVEYYVEDAVNGSLLNGVSTKVSRVLDGETYDASGNLVTDLTKLKPGGSYKVRLKGEYFKPNDDNGNEIVFYIRVRTKLITKAFNGKEKTTYTSWGIGRVNYLNCELMELD